MPTEETFGIVITAQMRHGDLWDAKMKLGSGKQFAELIGVTQSDLGRWINLKSYPSSLVSGTHPRCDAITTALFKVTGKLPDELWPTELIDAITNGRFSQKLIARREVPLLQLEHNYQDRALLPAPDSELQASEIREKIASMLDILSPRSKQIIRLRFGFDAPPMTYEEMGKVLKITKERVRQLEMRAVHRLSISPQFRDLVGEDDSVDLLNVLRAGANGHCKSGNDDASEPVCPVP